VRLAVDANIPVGLLLRPAGRSLLRDPRLELYAAEVVGVETEHNLERRIAGMLRHGRLEPALARVLLGEALLVGREQVQLVPTASYRGEEAAARRRMPHDLTDWPTIAVALGLNAAVWTEDRHFHGCGVACWTTETLTRELAALPRP
jgi:predicted nucleic acid-binding protein